jgi:hypothetical protein
MSLVVTDRRWAAPLSALALGFGLFVGVAIGPSAAGTLATGTQVVELPATSGGGEESPQVASAPPSHETFGSGATPEPEPLPAPSFIEGGESEAALPESGGGESKPETTPAGEEEEPEAPATEGIVVHVNAAAGSYTVAEAGGVLSTVHAGTLQPAGRELSVPTRELANGTLAEAEKPGVKASGRRQATVAGVVTFVDPDPVAPAYTLSARGVSMLIQVRPEASGVVPPLPVLGANAEVKVEIRPAQVAAEAESPPGASATIPPQGTTCVADPANAAPPPPAPEAGLWQRRLEAEPTPFTYSDLEGIVEAVCPDSRQVLVSADDLRQAGADLTLTVPEAIDASGLQVDDSVAATAEFDAAGTMTLTGLASDERLQGADDAKAAQGDLKP